MIILAKKILKLDPNFTQNGAQTLKIQDSNFLPNFITKIITAERKNRFLTSKEEPNQETEVTMTFLSKFS